MGRILAEIQELIGRDMAEVGLHADAVAMNSKTYEALKAEIGQPQPYSMKYAMTGIRIFIDDDIEAGKIHIGRAEWFREQLAYKGRIKQSEG